VTTHAVVPRLRGKHRGLEIDPLYDQQVGGMEMSASAEFGYFTATLALLAAWLRAAERRVRHGDLVGSVE
jgi:cytochrome c oxidase assembly factor CtaG